MPIGPAYLQQALVNPDDYFLEAGLSRLSDAELSERIRHTAATLADLAERFGQGPRSDLGLHELEEKLDHLADLYGVEAGRRDAALITNVLSDAS